MFRSRPVPWIEIEIAGEPERLMAINLAPSEMNTHGWMSSTERAQGDRWL